MVSMTRLRIMPLVMTMGLTLTAVVAVAVVVLGLLAALLAARASMMRGAPPVAMAGGISRPMVVLSGRRSCRCWRETLIWRAMLISTAALSAASPWSAATSGDAGRVICVCVDEAVDEADDDMLRFVMVLLASLDVELGGDTICHCGSDAAAGLKPSACRAAAGSSSSSAATPEDTLCGESRIRPDSSGPKWNVPAACCACCARCA